MTQPHKVVSHEQWVEARIEFLAKEKQFTRLRNELSQQRRALPWERVEKEYIFDGPAGKETLAQLFAGKSQLIIYHFMFAPEWEAGCKSCSFWADNFNGIDVHLRHRDISFLAVSRAPLAKLEAHKRRMGWSFKWVSSHGTGFNYDYYASFTAHEIAKGDGFWNYRHQPPGETDHVGISIFYRDVDGQVFHAGGQSRLLRRGAHRCTLCKRHEVSPRAWCSTPRNATRYQLEATGTTIVGIEP